MGDKRYSTNVKWMRKDRSNGPKMRPGYSICARAQSISLECLELNGSTSQTELTSRGVALIFFIKLIIKVFDFIIILN